MAGSVGSTLLQHLRRLIGGPNPSTVPDQQLLGRFLTSRDEAAFELLVWRHGPMVLNVCSRVLRNEHEVEDAFQVVFLKLARKASTIAHGESVGSWLYKVAYRTALRAAERVQARAGRELALGEMAVPSSAVGPTDEAAWRELRPVLDAEVRRLPEKYRSVFVLCCLQGMTNEQAARELGCPKGTVLSRLARARERLRKRLTRRGLAVGLVLPFLTTRCGERLLSGDLVASALRRVAESLGPAAIKAAGSTIAGLPAMLAAAGLALVLMVSSAGAYFYLSPPEHAPAPAKKGGAGCCKRSGTCPADPPAASADSP
jgi:HlyD family secretion protein